MSKHYSWIKKLGPGLLFAGAAIGVSHLVQSTKAGAMFGFGLVWAVVVANLMKYPFFEFGARYAAATGESLLHGYKKLGSWAIVSIIVITVCSMFTIQAAVTVVTAGIASSLFGTELGPVGWSVCLLIICMLILMVGKYNLLDKLIKVIIIILSVSTIAAVSIAVQDPVAVQPEFRYTFAWDKVGITFLIALMGWMPAPLDLSVWSSIWSLEKQKQLQSKLDLKEALFDFNIGYMGTAILALCFVSLGALVVYGTGAEIPAKGGAFANMLIQMYTGSLGEWAFPVIAIAAFTTMFSTTLTCLDAFPRVLGRTLSLFVHIEGDTPKVLGIPRKQFELANYWIWILIVVIGAIILLAFLGGHMGTMVMIATVMAFLTTPLFAFINLKVITGKWVPEAAKPRLWLVVLSWIGLLFLTGFSGVYVYITFMTS